MGKIKLIENFEKIAAGEVIQRPLSVVKELIENALDAHATQLFVTILNAGKDLIQVEDNGIGIPEGEISIAFKRHTSSKIATAEELDQLSTLGFRGEALASITAISQVEIISRPASQAYGVQLVLEAGIEIQKEQCGAPLGTTFKVKNLFYNLPVRRKFLKSNRVELGHISDIITRYSLAYPLVHFKLEHNGLILINSPPYPMNTAEIKTNSTIPIKAYGHSIQTIYGKKVFDDMIHFDFEDTSFSVRGYLGNPELNRSDRHASSVFVNYRLVQNSNIMSILNNAYKGYLMRHRFPFFVLFFTISPDQVDFNIHPSKKAVKFAKEEEIFQSLEQTLKKFIKSQFLFTNPQVISPITQKETFLNPSSAEQEIKLSNRNPTDILSSENVERINATRYSPSSSTSFDNSIPKTKRIHPTIQHPVHPQKNLSKYSNKSQVTQTHFKLPKKSREVSSSTSQIPPSTKNSEDTTQIHLIKSSINVSHLPTLNLLNNGIQAGKTYLIFQNDEGLILIDQHAAHERINLEKINQAYAKDDIAVQKLLVPLNFNVPPNESEFLKENLPQMQKIGFKIVYFGEHTFLLHSIPAILVAKQLKNSVMVQICLDIIQMGKISTFEKIRDEIVQYMACHESIRGGDEIWSQHLLEKLIRDLDQCENPAHCAHGRPTYIKISFAELEKRFHRIV